MSKHAHGAHLPPYEEGLSTDLLYVCVCSVWYKTTDSCFVTEWDIIEGNCKGFFCFSSSFLLSSRICNLSGSSHGYLEVDGLADLHSSDTDVLSSCGTIAETYTQGPSRTVFNTECNIIPEFVREPEDHTKMYQPEVDLTLTCSTDEGDEVLGNRYVTTWLPSETIL